MMMMLRLMLSGSRKPTECTKHPRRERCASWCLLRGHVSREPRAENRRRPEARRGTDLGAANGSVMSANVETSQFFAAGGTPSFRLCHPRRRRRAAALSFAESPKARPRGQLGPLT